MNKQEDNKKKRRGSIQWHNILVLLAIIVMGYCFYAFTLIGSRPDKVWVHRCNSIAKLHEMQERYRSFEVDICLREDGTMDVTHEEDTTFRLTVEPYFEYLGKHPQSRMWLDVKNLNEGNSRILHYQLTKLRAIHKVKREQLIIESTEWKELRQLTTEGYYTSCYVKPLTPRGLSREELARAVSDYGRVARSGCVQALSFDNKWYPIFKDQYKDTSIEFLTWKSHTSEYGLMLSPRGRAMLDDHRLRVILVKCKGYFHR